MPFSSLRWYYYFKRTIARDIAKEMTVIKLVRGGKKSTNGIENRSKIKIIWNYTEASSADALDPQ